MEGVNTKIITNNKSLSMKVKQKLFADLEPKLRGDCLLVTNTSSFLLKDVCSKMNNVESFGGLHFFNPVTTFYKS